jgi:putative Holliday junction resolvase
MRVLALDHGTVRIGCALSDPSGTLATPLPVIEPPEARAVAELVTEHGVEKVVVGLPLHLSGEEGSQAARDSLAAAHLLESYLESRPRP